jgi:hypothetical protein
MTHGSVLLDESRRHSRWHICRRQARRPDRKTAYRHPGLCVVLLVAAAAGLGACGGSSSPHVASLGKSGGISGKSGITSTTVGSVNPTQLLDEWAICLRSHSDPDQVDPTIDANNVIHITYPPGYNRKSQVGSSTTNSCDAYLTSASYALGGEPPVQNTSKMLAFSVCIRANGIPDFPDPTNTRGTYHFPIGVHFNSKGTPVAAPDTPSDLDPTSPTFQSGAKLCAPEGRRPTMGAHPRFGTGKHRGHCQ